MMGAQGGAGGLRAGSWAGLAEEGHGGPALGAKQKRDGVKSPFHSLRRQKEDSQESLKAGSGQDSACVVKKISPCGVPCPPF